MEFRVLGQLEAAHGGAAVSIGTFRQRSLLALLLVHANTVLSTDRILDELWGEEIGSERQGALWVHMSNLRTALEPDRPRRSEGTVVLTRAPGYVVDVPPHDLDATRFEELVGEGATLLDADPGAASVVLGEALGLWRGRAYEEFVYESFASAEIARLEELRLHAVELRVDADLRRGLAGALVGELDALVHQHPGRERVTAQLMTALHRSGRTGDAVRAYSRLRRYLADELGLDPSRALQDLERQILTGDRAVLDLWPVGDSRQRVAVRGYELRDDERHDPVATTYRAYQPTTGREVHIRVVHRHLADDPEFIREFEASAERVARLEHPHVVPLYDYWREPGVAYVVMRRVSGGTLADLLVDGPLATERAAQVASAVGSALAAAHRRGVVHGAVTPAHVCFDHDGHVYLGHFPIGPDHVEPVARSATAYVAPEQRAGGPATPRSDQFALAMVLAAALSGHVDEHPRGPSSLHGQVGDVMRRATAAEPLARFPDVAAFTSAVVAALAVPVASSDVVENPYKGLRAFDEADAGDFFGRERLVERLVARLADRGARGRCVVITGPSGSGKSSLVRAGLLPALRRAAVTGSDEWFVTTMVPGSRPFEALEAALSAVAVERPASLLDELVDAPSGLRRCVARILPGDASRLLLVVDQLEELYTHASEADARRFLDALVDAATIPSTPLRLVLTLRADFYDQPLRHPGFGELVRVGTEVITPMTGVELERAIDGPARGVGVRFERAVMADIVRDAGDGPGTLPLLQFALTELFERRHGATIGTEAYGATGGVRGALVRRAEVLYAELDGACRATVRQVLLRLVTIVGEDASPVRRRVMHAELVAIGPHASTVIDRLAQHRLVTFDREGASRAPTVEVAHEALLTEWARLRTWIATHRDDVRAHHELTRHVQEWRTGGPDDDDLLVGARLDRTIAWASSTELVLTDVEREYIAACVALRAQTQRHEHERAREAERHRRTARRRVRLLAVAVTVSALVLGVAAFAMVQRGHARRTADELAAIADARRLAAASVSAAAAEDPTLAMLLALSSLDVSARADLAALPEAEEAVHWALQSARLAYPVDDAPMATRVGPDGLTGIFRLPLADLVVHAREQLPRGFTPAECARHRVEPCPPTVAALASPIAAGNATVPADPPHVDTPSADRPLAGTTVELGGLGEPDDATRSVFAAFEEQTGIRVTWRTIFHDPDDDGLNADPPDVVRVHVGLARQLAVDGRLVDLGGYISRPLAEDGFGRFLVEQVSLGDTLFAVPVTLDLKGLVWYPTPEFEEAGYEVPADWAGLVRLSEQIVADGRTPWCVGFDTGPAAGWPATDWIEALVLRTGGVDVYDEWVAHDIDFDHPTVVDAADRFGEILFGDGFVLGGTRNVVRSIFATANPMLEHPPGCWLTFAASYLPAVVGDDRVAGEEMAFFVLPPIHREDASPVFGGATVLAAFADRPEVREFVRWMADPSGGPAVAASSSSLFLPAHAAFRSSGCESPALSPRANEVRTSMCAAVTAAVAADVYRFDASDHMPAEIGDPGRDGAFLTGMVELAQAGPDAVPSILARIDDAWPSEP